MVRPVEAAVPAPARGLVWRWRRLSAALLGGLATACPAAEIAAFQLTGIEGYANMRYLDDRQVASGGPGGRSQLAQAEWRNEVFLMSHSYVYHPNFLTLDVGGGPIFQLGEVNADGSATSSRDTLYNLVGRASFLRGKPVNGSLFYEHLNPTVSLSPGQVLNQENTRYGFDLSSALTPLPMRLEFTRSESRGSGAERVMDDRGEQLNLRLSHGFGALGSIQLQYQAARQESLSGSPNLPIQSSAAFSQGFNADTRLQFGAGGAYELSNLLALNSRRYQVGAETLPEQTDLSLVLDLRLKHSPQLNSFALYRYSDNDNGTRTAVSQSLAAGSSYAPGKAMDISLGLRVDDNRADEVSTASRGIDGGLRYQLELPLGTLQSSYSLRYDQRSQLARSAQAAVVGERLILAGSTATALAFPMVASGSVVVSNATRSQVYVENLDYTLSRVGSKTRLQRLIGGNILDGEELLVDYAYDVGGTYAYDQLDQTVSLNWAPSRLMNVYFREYHASPELSSGEPTQPLNAIQSRLYGLRSDFPFRFGIAMSAGGSIERENVVETIAPLRRQSGDFYLQTEEPLFDVGNLGLSLRRVSIEYANATSGMDLTGYALRFSTRRWFGVDFSATSNYERDTGGTVARQRWNDAISAQWRERKLAITARLARARETQGDFSRNHTMFQFTLRREL